MKHFICDRCDREFSYEGYPPYNGWIVDLEKYIVLCPNHNEFEKDSNLWIQNIRAAANAVRRKAPPLIAVFTIGAIMKNTWGNF